MLKVRVHAVVTVALCQVAWGCNIYGPELLPTEAADPAPVGGQGGTTPLTPDPVTGGSPSAPRPDGGSPTTDAGAGGSSPRDAGPQGGAGDQTDAAAQGDGGTQGGAGGSGGEGDSGGSGGEAAQGDGGTQGGAGGSGGEAAQGGAGGSGGEAAQGGAGGSGGAGGEAAQGGAGGSGGNPPIEPANPALIDDFEDGNLFIFQYEGRRGSWFTDSNPMDPAGSLIPPLTDRQATPLDEPRDGHRFGLHMVASGYALVGSWALFGTHLNLTESGQSAPYPLAAEYSGVRFWAKHGVPPAGPLPAPQIDLQLRTTDTTRVAGLPAAETGDNDHYGASVTLTAQWKQHTVPWTHMSQGGWGKQQPLNPQRGTSIQFNLAAPAQGYDIWLDELEFFKASK